VNGHFKNGKHSPEVKREMTIETVSIASIKPYANNSKLHPQEQIEQIKRSIEEFGFNDPIAVDETDTIIEGHGRYIALNELGYTEVPIIRLSHLTPAQKKAYIIAHNKLTMNSGFDLDILKEELKSIQDELDQTITGFNLEELEDVLQITEDEVYEDDPDVELPEEPKAQTGDIWQLGNHKLICGDSTKQETYIKLLGNDSVDLVVTDPPYNVDYGSKAEAINKYGYKFSDRHIENDYMPELQFVEFLTDAFEGMKQVMKTGAGFYIFHASITVFEFEMALRNNGLKSRQQLIWNKNAIVLGRQDYQWKHEPCLYGWKDGSAHYFVDDRTQTTVQEDEKIDFKKLNKKELVEILQQIHEDKISTTIINENKPSKSAEHPTMKPIKLLARLIKNSSKTNGKILDNFGGSGSTLIACEQLGRQAYLIELDPRFIDVIVKRYKKLRPDGEAILIRDGKLYTYDDIYGGE
jgi:DNA modification methylase